jgi:hypothetical protein
MSDTVIIEESGIRFGPFHQRVCFNIEKSKVYINIQDKLKIAEFILMPDTDQISVWIVEAKSSSPQCLVNSDFIKELHEKFANSFSLLLAMRIGRHKAWEDELPESFKNFNPGSSKFSFILVIKGHKKDWLPPITECLKKTLKPFLSLWSISDENVAVINDKMAQSYKLISTEAKA